MQIGSYILPNNLVLAPMAGISDRPFRQLCKKLGAGYAVSEMAAANPLLRDTLKSRKRIIHDGESGPHAVQIVGSVPAIMADSARYHVDQGADIIDINMGCPAKKVCNNWCGSALLQNESLVGEILDAVVQAVPVPVTLKFRTGWDRSHINAPVIARIAESAGIAMLTLHGRTRADGYRGEAEYDTIAEVKSLVSIPVVANGDIDSPQKAKTVLDKTGADALMVGRAAQGKPWIFREIGHFLQHGTFLPSPSLQEIITLFMAKPSVCAMPGNISAGTPEICPTGKNCGTKPTWQIPVKSKQMKSIAFLCLYLNAANGYNINYSKIRIGLTGRLTMAVIGNAT